MFNILLSDVYEGYTLITNIGGAPGIEFKSDLINNNYEIINSWDHTDRPFGIAYLSSDSILTVGYKGDFGNNILPRIIQFDWWNSMIVDIELNVENFEPHHDIELMPNGNILLIGWETKSPEETLQAGKIDNSQDFKPDKIIEIEIINNNSFEIVWEWCAWDHLIQDFDPSKNNYGVIADNPGLVDINLVGIGPGFGDWMHTNSISYNSQLDQIVLSVRHLCELWVIDHSTSTQEASGHSGGNSGKGGDIIYRWGNPQNYDRGIGTDQRLDAQHGIVWIDDGYPGEGNFLIFNNRNAENSSAVIEIIPPIDNYQYILNQNDSYGPINFDLIEFDYFSLNQSGAFRLLNGNTIITISQEDKIIELDNNENIVWEYDHLGGGFIPRAKKYPLNYFDSNLIGDLDNNNLVDIIDALILVDIVLLNIQPSQNQLINSDLNQDDFIDIYDIIIIINLIL